MNTVCVPIEPTQAPSARRSRAPWVVAGATPVVVAIVAVLGFVFIGHKSTRQVVLPFTGLNNPLGVAVDSTGAVYVADEGNNRVLKLPPHSAAAAS